MRWGRARPEALPVGLPDLAGGGWPDPAELGRPGFATATYRELGVRHAYDAEAHAVADRLVAELLPLVPVTTRPEDAPYLRKVLLTSARQGAGLAVVERTLPASSPSTVDRELAGALWEARRALPASLLPDARAAACFFLLAGFCTARNGPELVERLADSLRA